MLSAFAASISENSFSGVLNTAISNALRLIIHAEFGAQVARARPIPLRLVLPAHERHFSLEIVLEVYMLADVGEYMTGLGRERLDGTRRGAR